MVTRVAESQAILTVVVIIRNKKTPKALLSEFFMELPSRIELPTSSLPRKCSTY